MLKKLLIAVIAAASMLMFTACEKGDKVAWRAYDLYKEGKYEEALAEFETAKERGLSAFGEAKLYNCMGTCYFHMGDYKTCIEYQKKCIELEPEHFNAWVSLGVCHRKLGDNAKALECYEKALKYDSKGTGSASLYASLGSLYIEKNKPMSAIQYLEKAKELSPEYSDVYAFLSIAYKMAYETEKSDEAFEKAKALGYPKLDEIQEQLNKIS